ncbi:hypothetical protein LN042_33980 [Kitasatospora sp. RB6PN24]|uniref:hypothetical protein n=1 Tax=Kitasatospora humi TaxID=2893891 RepID=UPI001E2E6C8B|nr:hypothetical protein [Kitasatospora humi]MCC9312014.1 hypothetical protein [Kitasatospora humi]
MRELTSLKAFLHPIGGEPHPAGGGGDAEGDFAGLPGRGPGNPLRPVSPPQAQTGRIPAHAVLGARSLAEIHSVLERQA